ncbi:hypothetical protein [Desulfitobacterium sp.]|uniref:hypothetical protein n=1 Tax=Desulfitobacterium sp. TaxID=49981 RepID=UPI002B1ED801|nr:hypothetical protein [Desulfitobacterium sp.]MEA4902192.1 hypothetical protein [Desulfitobacterium sp.]
MYRKLMTAILILVMVLGMAGCGSSTAEEQQQNDSADQTPQTDYLTPVPEGSSLVDVNIDLSKQLMEQEDVLGNQIYEQNGITYGDITFKSEVDKKYAHNLLKEFLAQLKTSYSGKEITVQAVSEGNVFDSISFKP